jgi:hypothetical protein
MLLQLIYDFFNIETIFVLTEKDFYEKTAPKFGYRLPTFEEKDQVYKLMKNLGIPNADVYCVVVKQTFWCRKKFRVLYQDQNLQIRQVYGYF